MRQVADWQLSQKWLLTKDASGRLIMGPKTWESGAFYPGILDIYRVTNDQKYLDAAKAVAKLNEYQGGSEVRNADHQAILQTYLELYEFDKDPNYTRVAKSILDSIMHAPKYGAIEYSWCDLLFMGPPVWIRFAKISHDVRYLDYQDKIYWEAVQNLFDQNYHLFYRDARFKKMTGPSGKSIFWSRGNGWVIAGLARILDYMPKNYPSRSKYELLFKQMALAIKPLQQQDGFWKADLLEPASYPVGETSGTAFFCYAIAWGINNGLLPEKEYRPSVVNGWKALTTAVHNDGKLGFVQPGGDRPYKTNYELSNWYSAGAFLMAGRQVLKLI